VRQFVTRNLLILSVRVAFLALICATSWLVPAQPARASSVIAGIDPQLQQLMLQDPLKLQPVIVEMEHVSSPLPGANLQLANQALNLLRLNGVARVALPLVASAAGLASSVQITALSLVPGVAYVHVDAPVKAHASTADLVTAYPKEIEADRIWATGKGGEGITVAVLDSGITPDPDLTQPTNRILTSVNFADAPGPLADAGGHGTHVAGTIGGNGFKSAGQYVGIAPGVGLVDVRVLDKNGNGRMSSVILGVQWALSHRLQYHIRVLNMSLGAQVPGSYRLDPLSAAVEMAWLRGLVVVVASGNSGGAPDSPGADPYPITVGSIDDQGTATVSDDAISAYSAYGTPLGSTPKPDVVAPGRRIVSLRAVGSTLDSLLPDRVTPAANGSTYFRLSGTSMSTAVVAGVVALVLQQHPSWTPDQVKAVLKSTTRPFGSAGSSSSPAAGAGLVDAYSAHDAVAPAQPLVNRALRPTDTFARGIYPALYGQRLTWKDPLLGGLLWNLLGWSNLTWDNLAWDNLAWDNIAWDNLAWDNLAWDNIAWDNLAWDNLAWDNIAWDSQTLD
jgi:serine protease AprX